MAGAVIVANSLVARGSVGGRASLSVLERAGVPVVFVPTVVLAWHPGHGPATREVPAGFDAIVDDIAGAPWLGEVCGVLTGYLGAARQAAALARLVGAVKDANREAVHLCDPVIGDERGLYVPAETATAMRDELMPNADIATPNLFELAWLAGSEPGDLDAIAAAASALAAPEVAVTSVLEGNGETGAAAFTSEGAWLARHARVEDAPHGTGDLFAALYLARRLAGTPSKTALAAAAGGAFAMAERAADAGLDELPLATAGALLDRPVSGVTVARL